MSTNKPKHVCCVCNEQLTRTTTLRDHLRSHAGVKLFPCSVCGRPFNRIYDMREHEKQVHQQLRPHRCRQQDDSGRLYGCEAAFKRKRDLERHRSRQGGDACRAIVSDQHVSSPSSMCIVLRYSGPEIDAETTSQDGIISEEPDNSSSTELSLLARTTPFRSRSALVGTGANNAIKTFRPSMHALYDWRLVVLSLSRATVTLLEALRYPGTSHYGPDLRSSQPLLQYSQDLNRGAQQLIKHNEYGPLRLCVNGLFVIAACQQHTNQLRIHTKMIDWLHEQYDKHPPPTGPSIGMWSFGGQHYLPLDHVQNWRSGRLSTQSVVRRLRIDSGWFELESDWLSTLVGRN